MFKVLYVNYDAEETDGTDLQYNSTGIKWFPDDKVYLVIMSFASILPATPGYIGLYQISAIVTFGLYNIGINEAFAYSIL